MRNHWDVAVIGGGVAGMSAAQVVAESGRSCVLLERTFPGGQVANVLQLCYLPGLRADLSGADLSGSMLEAVMDLGVEIRYEEATSLKPGTPHRVTTASGELTADAVVVATGKSAGSFSFESAASYAGRGLSECASCDGPIYAGKSTVIVGDDEWTAQEALELAAVADRVTVVSVTEPRWSRRRGDLLEASGNIAVRTGIDVVDLMGQGALEAVALSDGTTIEASGIFPMIGRVPNSGFAPTAIASERGITTDGALATTEAGVFAAGDIRAGSEEFISAAIGEGLAAGRAAVRFLPPKSH